MKILDGKVNFFFEITLLYWTFNVNVYLVYTLAFLKKPNDFLRGKPKKWRLAFENNNKDLKTETTIQLRVPVCGEYYHFFSGRLKNV